jgi:phosphoglycerate dehydrogenase-like enzyme
VPAGLRFEVVGAELGEPGLPGADEVEVVVPPYGMGRYRDDAFTGLPRLRAVQVLSAGVDNVRHAVPEGVILCNGRGVHDASTAEMALTLTLASLRDIPWFVRGQERQEWDQSARPALADKHVLLVGAGQIGRAIEERLRPFEVTIERVARTAREGVHPISEVTELLPRADVVILIVPGTPETHHLVDAAFLAAMRPGALLVNVARGSVVDTDALLAALTERRITAAIDVTDPEPLPAGHPLWSAPGLLLTPHVGGASSAMLPRAHKLVREQLARYAAGEPLANQVSGAY